MIGSVVRGRVRLIITAGPAHHERASSVSDCAGLTCTVARRPGESDAGVGSELAAHVPDAQQELEPEAPQAGRPPRRGEADVGREARRRRQHRHVR